MRRNNALLLRLLLNFQRSPRSLTSPALGQTAECALRRLFIERPIGTPTKRWTHNFLAKSRFGSNHRAALHAECRQNPPGRNHASSSIITCRKSRLRSNNYFVTMSTCDNLHKVVDLVPRPMARATERSAINAGVRPNSTHLDHDVRLRKLVMPMCRVT